MSFIVKCDPPSFDPQGDIQVEELAYEGASPQAGDEVFVWTSETASGQGLEMYGLMRTAERQGRKASMRIRIAARMLRPVLTKAMLESHRDSDAAEPIVTLAKKLYWHAHNKVARLDKVEVRFLRSQFRHVLRQGGPVRKRQGR